MKKSEKIWSISTLINFFLVIWFAFLTNYCQTAMKESQNSIPPPPPDDYIGALVYLLLVLVTIVFGVLFAISLLTLIVLFMKNKYFKKSENL